MIKNALSIKTKILIVIIIFIIFSSMITGAILSSIMVNDKTIALKERMREINSNLNINIKNNFNIILDKINDISKDESIVTYVKTYDINSLRSTFNKYFDYYSQIALINSEAKEVLKVTKDKQLYDYTDYSNDNDFKNLNNDEKKIYTMSHEFLIGNIPCIKILYKCQDEWGDIICYLSAIIPLENIIKELMNNKFGDSGFVSLVNSNGVILYHKNKDIIFKKLNEKGIENSVLIKNINQMKTAFTRCNLNNIDAYIFYSPNTFFKWSIISVFPYKEFSKPIKEMRIAVAVIIFIVSIIIGILVFSIFSKILINPLLKVVNITKSAGDGDLSVQKLEISSKDEIGILTDSINVMIESFNRIIFQVITTIEQVAEGSYQVSSASQSLSQCASEQASSLEEIVSSISTIYDHTKQNVITAGIVNDLSKESMENATNGNAQMTELVHSIDEINNSSDAVKNIVKIINDISFQINLLSLNASVEAAHAGKYGKGFAVVAEEIRNLAVKTSRAVNESSGMIERSISNIKKGVQLVNITAKQLEEIVNGAKKVSGLIEEITNAAEEQSQNLEHINAALGQIDQITQSNVANAEESASSSEELADQANLLRGMIKKFKLRESIKNPENAKKDSINQSPDLPINTIKI